MICVYISLILSLFLQPLTNGKRARDDRPIHSLQSAHRVISLAGLSGTAASASILAIDRSDVPPDYQPANSYRPHQFTHVNGIVGPNGAVYVTTSARNVPTPQHHQQHHQQQQQQLATTASPSPADADLAVNPQYTKLVNRSQTPRYTIKPLNTLRKLRSRQALAKAKSVSTSAAAAAASAAAAAAATTTPSKTVTVSAVPVPLPTALTANGASRSGRMVVSVMNRQQMATTGASAAASSPQKTADGDDSDTNCSSLDDDDDFDGKSLYSSL